jgi:hypothetical protein
MQENYGLKVGDICRLKSNPTGPYAKIRSIIPPRIAPNPHGYKIAYCEWSVHPGDSFVLGKYFALRNLKKETPECQK